MNLKNYRIDNLEEFYALKSWWTIILVIPLSKYFALFFLNYTKVSANTITIFAIIFRVFTIIFFLNSHFMLGATSFYLAHLLDCIDGVIARATKSSTDFGRYLDHVSDLLGDVFILLSLAWNQKLLAQPFIWSMVFLHIAESYISYLSGFAMGQHNGSLDEFILIRWYNRYRQAFFGFNYKSFISFPDYTAMVFIVFPLLGLPSLGLKVGFFVLLTVVPYTVLSTFVSLHTQVKAFP